MQEAKKDRGSGRGGKKKERGRHPNGACPVLSGKGGT